MSDDRFGGIPPEQTVTARRHDIRVHVLECIGQIVGMTPRVPDETEPAPRPQHGSRLGGGDRQVEPVPGLRRRHPVEGATRRVPAFEGSNFHVDPVAAGDVRHSWRELHTQHLGPALGHLPRSDPGATPHVENLQARRRGTEQFIDHRIGIGRPEPVVGLGVLVEQPRAFLGERSRCPTVAFLARIHRRQPGPERTVGMGTLRMTPVPRSSRPLLRSECRTSASQEETGGRLGGGRDARSGKVQGLGRNAGCGRDARSRDALAPWPPGDEHSIAAGRCHFAPSPRTSVTPVTSSPV